MKELIELLDKLIELGKVYGLPGLVIGAFTAFLIAAFKVTAENIVVDRKHRRTHERQLVKMRHDLAKLTKPRKRKE